MNDEEALKQLGCECPRKIMGMLHAKGHYFHYVCSRFPSKILCFHKDSEVPGDCVPTEAQAHFSQTVKNDAQATG